MYVIFEMLISITKVPFAIERIDESVDQTHRNKTKIVTSGSSFDQQVVQKSFALDEFGSLSPKEDQVSFQVWARIVVAQAVDGGNPVCSRFCLDLR